MRDPEVLEVGRDEPGELVAAIEELASAGGGWCNVVPVVADETIDTTPSPSLFSARGPAVPFATFVARRQGRFHATPASAGIAHGMGTKAGPVLEQWGVVIPGGWRMRQDHVKRGLVFELPNPVAPVDVASFVLDASTALCQLELHGRFLVALHRR